ncbi:acylneuraminate cytidylyltransferase family protein [Candidatus Woesearchaeota archaeon]|nr:acylneuraminate cytidylyltransferase family protein [Candidatus Woesearchaeota archaeon]
MQAARKSVTAIIPLKGHSERVPSKNMRLLSGKPLYHWIVGTLRKARGVSEIVVDTDSSKIKSDIESNFPFIRVIERPKALIGDKVSVNKLIQNAIGVLDGDYFIQTHATNPLLKASTIDNAIDQFFSSKSRDSLFSVTRIQARLYDAKCRPVNHNPDELIRTQDLEPVFEENSSLYIFSRKSFMRRCTRIDSRPLMFEIGVPEALDIDTEQDFLLTQALMKMPNV